VGEFFIGLAWPAIGFYFWPITCNVQTSFGHTGASACSEAASGSAAAPAARNRHFVRQRQVAPGLGADRGRLLFIAAAS